MELAELIAEYIVAKTELDRLKVNRRYLWGYYLHDQVEKVDSLSKQIDAKVVELATKAGK